MNANGGIIYAFIDSQNLNLSIKKDVTVKGRQIYSGWPLDFKKFYRYLKTKYQVDEQYLFIGKKAGNENLYAYLEGIGYKVIYKPCVVYTDTLGTKSKGNVDAELVLHTMIQLPNYQQAMIVSGDGDYFCLIEYLVNINKLFKVAIPNKQSFSQLLKPYLQYAFYVTDLKTQLERT